MFQQKRIAVIVPAYNEELLIESMLRTIPDFVDDVIVIDDASTDLTASRVHARAEEDSRIHILHHETNRGVGAAISSGYVWCRERGVDVAVVMAGDRQMDPNDLPAILDPVVSDRADYSKGNRLLSGEAWETIPRVRYLGNSVLTFLTKIASGYWHVTDSQSGYTAINKKALNLIPLKNIYPRYGMPNDLLVTLNIFNLRVADVPIRPIYNIGEKSGIKIHHVVFPLSLLIMRLFFRRMISKYVVRDFHPLVLFYSLGFLLLWLALLLGARLIFYWHQDGIIPSINALAVAFFSVVGFQSILFAMLFDMEANRDLKGG